MVVLGLLQNQWAHNPHAVAAMFARHPDRRSTLIWYMLARSLSGRRLQRAFGDWVGRITWEEASPAIAGRSNVVMKMDIDHINRRLTEVRPDVVLAFGVSAAKGIAASVWCGVIINGPHPAARFVDIQDRLTTMRVTLDVEQLKSSIVCGTHVVAARRQ